MRKSVDSHMTEIYCFVDEFFKGQWRRSLQAQPRAATLTIEIEVREGTSRLVNGRSGAELPISRHSSTQARSFQLVWM